MFHQKSTALLCFLFICILVLTVLEYHTNIFPLGRSEVIFEDTKSLEVDSIILRRVLDDGISFYVSDVHHNWVLNYEQHVMDALRNATKKDSGKQCVVVDVGMNDGFFTNMAAVRGCNVWSFELQPTCIDKAVGAMRVNGVEQKVTLYRRPVSDSENVLQIPHDPLAPCSGARGILPLLNCAADGELQPWMCPQNNMSKTAEFRPVVLSRELPSNLVIDFLKIDTEGHEIQVLRGTLPLFKEKRVRFAMVETFPPMWTPPYGPSQERVIRLILQYGYQMRCAQPRGPPLDCQEQKWFDHQVSDELLLMIKHNRCTDWFVEPIAEPTDHWSC